MRSLGPVQVFLDPAQVLTDSFVSCSGDAVCDSLSTGLGAHLIAAAAADAVAHHVLCRQKQRTAAGG
jgi:hypothetical protein